jgi:hypothetical protein
MAVVVRIFLISAVFLSAAAHGEHPAHALIGYAVQGESAMPDLGAGASVAAREYYAAAELPVYATDSRSLSLGLDYQYTHYEYRGVNSRNRDLHRLQFPVRFAGFRSGSPYTEMISRSMVTLHPALPPRPTSSRTSLTRAAVTTGI